MSYSPKEVAKFAGISVRTLHWYDRLGLLKPLYRSTGGRRYYGEEQLLRLQHILILKELGFTLAQIEQVIGSTPLQKMQMFMEQKRLLESRRVRIEQQIATVNTTIAHLKGEINMSAEQFFEGLRPIEGRDFEGFLATFREKAEEVKVCRVSSAHQWSDEERKTVAKEGREIFEAICREMKNGNTPDSDGVQKLIESHIELLRRFHLVDKGLYEAYAGLYRTHPDFRSWFASLDPHLADFTAEAMEIYVRESWDSQSD